MFKKKSKKKSSPIFPPETGEVKPQPIAMQSPADATALASGYAGLGCMGSIGEEIENILKSKRNEFSLSEDYGKQIAELI